MCNDLKINGYQTNMKQMIFVLKYQLMKNAVIYMHIEFYVSFDFSLK